MLFQLMKNNSIKINWEGTSSSNELCINKYAEANSKIIKNQVFGFINGIRDKSVGLDFLGVNIWEMSTIIELNLYKSQEINDIIKLFSIFDIIKKNKLEEIIIVNIDSRSQDFIKKCFSKKDISLNFENSFKSKKIWKNSVPNILKSMLFFFRFFKIHFHFILSSPIKKKFKKDDIILLGYFANFERDKINNIKTSNCWGELPKLLKENNLNPFISNIYVKTNIFQSSYKAKKHIEGDLNQNFVMSFINIIDLFHLLIKFISFYFNSKKIENKLKKEFIYSGFDLFPFFKQEIKRSIKGVVLFENLIWIKSFQNYVKSIDKEIDLIYIHENQSWELPLLKFFKTYSKGKIIAWQSQFVRKWDLRYYYKFEKLYIPDYFLVNSNNSRELFLEYGYSKKKILNVEHLRNNYNNKINRSSVYNNSILILGDYNMLDTINLINDLAPELKLIFDKVGLKAHPSKSIPKKIIKKYNLLIEEEKIDLLISKYECFIATNSSGAVIDLVLRGIIPLVYTPSSILNNSPIGKYEEILIRNNIDLKNKIKNIKSNKIQISNLVYTDLSYKNFKGVIKRLLTNR